MTDERIDELAALLEPMRQRGESAESAKKAIDPYLADDTERGLVHVTINCVFKSGRDDTSAVSPS